MEFPNHSIKIKNNKNINKRINNFVTENIFMYRTKKNL